MTDDDMEDPVFDRFDAAVLLAVEGANGGEWAGLGQVLATFQLLFREWPDPEDFAGSCELLLAARLLTCENEGLALAPAGRKLLRRSGRHGSPTRPTKVAELLTFFDERDLADGSEGAGPSVEQVAAARAHLTDDVREGFATLYASNEARLSGPAMVLPGGIAAGTGYDTLAGRAIPDEDEASTEEEEEEEEEASD